VRYKKRVEDRVEAAVSVCETVGRKSDSDERVRDSRLIVACVKVLDNEDDVDRQPAGTKRGDDDDDKPRHSASHPPRLGRPGAMEGGSVPGRPPTAAATHAGAAQQAEYHAGVEGTDERHWENEGEGEERPVEYTAVMWVVGK